MKKIYLAGPDVFDPNSSAIFARLEALCISQGLQGVRPSDEQISSWTGSKRDISLKLYQANVALIQQCDAVLANVNPFRGQFEPDSGTCFEIGYAIALNKPVALYLQDTRPMVDKIQEVIRCSELSGAGLIDTKYNQVVEDLDQPVNLMLAVPCPWFKSESEALAFLASSFGCF